MDDPRIIHAPINIGRRYAVTTPITQYDYGYLLLPEGVELPTTYEIDFSNDEKHGTSLIVYGDSEGAEVPEELIRTGKDVYAFYYHIGEGYGKTEFTWRIPNKCRPSRGGQTPTPSQQSSIDQLIVRSNEAVTSAEQSAQDAAASAQSAQGYAEQAESARDTAQGYANNAQTSATSAQTSETNAALSADTAEQAKQAAQRSAEGAAAAKEESVTASETADRAADRAVAAKLAAADSEANAAEYERQAGTQAGAARSAADTAVDKATQAAQSASEASAQNTAAQTAKTGAETARAGSESARDQAVAANTSAQQSETAMRELLEEYSDVATEATAQEILQREEDGLALMEFALRALDNRLDTMVEDLPHDTTGQQLAEALNFGNSMLNALYNELANEEV